MRIPLIAFSLIGLVSAVVSAAPAERQAAVENGLRPATYFQGDPTWTLAERMEHHGVPGVSIAVIDDFEVDWYGTYGLADRKTGAPVRPTTLFQAGSVSKPVAAFGALVMVADGRLDLDRPVNEDLVTWRIPDNEFTAQQPVNLFHLLSHTGGLTVHGFPGYASDQRVPTLVQVLDGIGPANTEPIHVDQVPGQGWRYSGGGYTVAQQLMIDVAGRGFPDLMHNLVLGPLGMNRSTFANPLPPELLIHAAAGVLPDGSDVPGKRHTYPEMAAAGLWTTAEDLARFAVGVQLAWRGESESLPREMAARMLEPVGNGYGLGLSVYQRGDATYFSHGGWDEGFLANIIASRDSGDGLVVMVNVNRGDIMEEILQAVAVEYDWEGFEPYELHPVPEALLAFAPGRYRYNAELAIRVYREGDRLFMCYTGGTAEELLHIGDDRFMRRNRTAPICFGGDDGDDSLHFETGSGALQTHARLAEGELLPREILVAGRFEEAVLAYRRVLEATPDESSVSEDYLNDRGLSALDTDFEHGIVLLRVATELFPESANTWDSLGLAYRQAGDLERAEDSYRRALERDPEYPSALRALAEMGLEP